VGEDDMAADVVELEVQLAGGARLLGTGIRTKPSSVTSVEARPPGISFESTIIHEGPSCRCLAHNPAQFHGLEGVRSG
jgi:hypothetical protein